MRPTHVAYADESYCTAERYRSVATVTLARETADDLVSHLFKLLSTSGLKEFKWSKLRQARERFAALKFIDLVVEEALKRKMRVDVLVWDTEDSRHKVKGRDDQANLQRMYYHLFKNVLHRWPSGSTWTLYPDRNSALDWVTVADFLDTVGFDLKVGSDLLAPSFRIRIERDFRISEIVEAHSTKTPLCQVADFFAGLGVFSRKRYMQYRAWLERQSNQLPLFPSITKVELSNSDRERCTVLKYLNDLCKRHKLGVGLRSSHGLQTYNPANPINFWLYEPQHPEDKAPLRSSEM